VVTASRPTHNNMITFQLESGNTRQINKKHIKLSGLLMEMTEDDDNPDESGEVPLLGTTDETMDDIISFLEYHANNPPIEIPKPLPFFERHAKDPIVPGKELKDIVGEWDSKFVDRNYEDWVKLTEASSVLSIEPLKKLCFTFFAFKVGNKDVEEAREFYKISTKQYTEEEILEKKKSDPWRWIFMEYATYIEEQKKANEERIKKMSEVAVAAV